MSRWWLTFDDDFSLLLIAEALRLDVSVETLLKEYVERALSDRTRSRDGRDPAAVELGRRGGLVGGHARAAAMTAEERSEAARKAVRARWDRRK